MNVDRSCITLPICGYGDRQLYPNAVTGTNRYGDARISINSILNCCIKKIAINAAWNATLYIGDISRMA
ncbi:MAG: hypothetical protein EZS28_018627 [Streblomastix strix]|uniref:Uncharacterized protein n=1 Tax=Streblomastix strix TaxID=222440 RepID=A0A5J4VUL6_9EUKA|nr:MAG: hypothetical protein EZS28_018627 [Streblomastix strix]